MTERKIESTDRSVQGACVCVDYNEPQATWEGKVESKIMEQ